MLRETTLKEKITKLTCTFLVFEVPGFSEKKNPVAVDSLNFAIFC